jgi:hypothetical protein
LCRVISSGQKLQLRLSLPGEALPGAEVMVFNILTGQRTDVKTAPLEIPFQGGPGFFPWSPDGKSFFYEHGSAAIRRQSFASSMPRPVNSKR